MEDRNNRRRTRREFLRQAGKLALYTPPAVVLLTRPSLAQINGSLGRPPQVVANPPGSQAPGGNPRNQ
jgi:hypothetical protein